MTVQKNLKLAKKDGGFIPLQLNEYQAGDEAGLISCIREEYGETYFRRSLYCTEEIRKKAESGEITFLTARMQSNKIAGMMILIKLYPEENVCELASLIIRKKYRGYGLAMRFFEYGTELLNTRSCSAAVSLPVMFHNMTQRLLHQLGFCACGFILNVFDLKKVRHSYNNGRNTKHSQGIQVMPMKKRKAGVVYLPAEHREFCRKIYENLGAEYVFGDGRSGRTGNLYSDITWEQDDVQSSIKIRILHAGTDLAERIHAICAKYPLKGRQTANIFLNCSDQNAIRAYKCLKKLGYFFTGLEPLCSENEYMVLHHPGEIKMCLEDYAVSEEFAVLLGYVKACYEERQRTLRHKKTGKRYEEKNKGDRTEGNGAAAGNGIFGNASDGSGQYVESACDEKKFG